MSDNRRPRPHAPNGRVDRAPLLFMAGNDDNLIPPALNKSNAAHYKTGMVAFKEFPGRSHLTVAQEGWQQVADYALDWALKPSANNAPQG